MYEVLIPQTSPRLKARTDTSTMKANERKHTKREFGALCYDPYGTRESLQTITQIYDLGIGVRDVVSKYHLLLLVHNLVNGGCGCPSRLAVVLTSWWTGKYRGEFLLSSHYHVITMVTFQRIDHIE